MKKISVAILTFNRRDQVLRAIESVYQQDIDDIEIVLVDSASSDGTKEAVSLHYPNVKVIQLSKNLGCPGGRNYLYSKCTGDYIVNLDDDGCLCDRTIRSIVKIFDTYPDIGVIAFRRVDADRKTEGNDDENLSEVSFFSGGLSAFRRDMLKSVGDYPEYFFFNAEEAHLALRIMNAGYRIVYAPNVLMQHSKESNSGNTKWDFFRFRNPLLVVIELFPGWLCFKYLFLRTARYCFISIKRRTFQMYVRAVFDILLNLPKILKRRKPVPRMIVYKYFKLRKQHH